MDRIQSSLIWEIYIELIDLSKYNIFCFFVSNKVKKSIFSCSFNNFQINKIGPSPQVIKYELVNNIFVSL